MPRSGTFLEAVISYYSNLAFGALASMRSTQEDLRTGKFEVSKAIGGAVSFWLDASEGWWSALLVTASEPLPTVFLRIGPRGSTATQEVRVLAKAEPEFTGLVHIGSGAQIDKSMVTIEPTAMGDGLKVKLKGLKDPRPPAGLYQGLVHIGDKPLAIVMVHVEGSVGPPRRRRAGQKGSGGKPHE